ncbi:MAG: alkaline phosphatase family protein, partial [Bacteroidales bacterium]|nr:alkaline phosphatase family protein [Bacteroidales bacterium]
TKKDDDLTAVVDLLELKPASTFYYEILIDGNKIPMIPQPSFTTNPVNGTKGSYKIAFGGGAGYASKNERMWDTLLANDLMAFLTLGDNVYIDKPESPETQRHCYYQRQCRPEYNRFTASTPQYAIYDDHDFAVDDYAGTTAIDSPAWKLNVLEVFKQNFNNPSYGLGEENPGCHHKISIGDIDFFMLDCRFYREDPTVFRNPTMLGKEQRTWLLKELKRSKATFKVIVSSVPFTPGVKLDNSSDTWDGFKQERARIFSFIERRKIEGVFLVSADRHRSDARKIHRPHGYDLYEFESSKLTNRQSHDLIQNLPGSTYLFGYNEKCSFGLLKFNTELKDPEVEFQVVSIDNEVINSVVVKRSELEFCKKKKIEIGNEEIL